MFAQNDLILEMGKLQKFALRLTRNKPDADDLVQSTCLRALEKSDYFEDGSNLFSWTSKIMYNIFVSGYRHKVKFETQFDPEPYLEKQAVMPVQDTIMEFSDVQKAMSQLSKKYRNILFLICIEGRRYQEVSEILQIPLGTVRSRLSRARAQLQLTMDKPSEKYANMNMPVIPAYMADHALRQRI
jgi:RNA polymerase sigma-70 factor (ECF subfamily)